MTGEASTVALAPGEGATIRNRLGGAITSKAIASETGGTMTALGPPLGARG